MNRAKQTEALERRADAAVDVLLYLAYVAAIVVILMDIFFWGNQ